MTVIVWPNAVARSPILSRLLIKSLRNKLVIEPWANTELVGEFSGIGNKVTVPVFPTITLTNTTWTTNPTHTAGKDIAESTFAIVYRDLELDTLYQKNIRVGDFEQFTSNIQYVSNVMAEYVNSVGQILDTAVGAIAMAGAGTSDGTAGTTVIDKTNIYTTFEKFAVKLNEENAPEDRAVFMLPEMASQLRQSDVYKNTEHGLDIKEKGLVTIMSGFHVYETNNLAAEHMFAMSRGAVHFAAAFIGLKTTEAENAFATKVLAELVYGGTVFVENKNLIYVQKYDSSAL